MIVVTTEPVLDTPVKPAVVAVDVLPLSILLLMLKVPQADELTTPTNAVLELAPPTELLRMVLVLILAVEVAATVPCVRICSSVPDVKLSVIVIVLFVIFVVPTTVAPVE